LVDAGKLREVFRSRGGFMTAFVAGDAEAAVKEMERNLNKVHRFHRRPMRPVKSLSRSR